MRGGALFSCFLLFVLGCGRTALDIGDLLGGEGGSGSTTATSTGQAGQTTAVTSTGTAAGGEGGGGAGGGSGGAPEGVVAYVQSRTHLYVMFDDLVPISIGELDGCFGDALDIAVDEVGSLYVSAPASLYRVNPTNASCSLIAHGSYPNALTVISPLPNDPPTLVGFNTTTYVRIDKNNGGQTTLGSLGTTEFYSSGDVAMHDGRMYLAISGSSCFDCLAEVDRQTGALVKVVGPIGFAKVFGLMSYDGWLYGFTNAGEVITIDVMTGAANLVSEFSIEFWGAARYP